MDKVLNQREEITLPDTLESLVAQLSIRAMQSVDIEACNRGEAFFNDEEFEAESFSIIELFIVRNFMKFNKAIFNNQLEESFENPINITLPKLTDKLK